MNKRIIIAGAGFAGMWAAISAARLIHLNNADNQVDIFLVSPEPKLTIRPRLYEAVLEKMDTSMLDVLNAANVKYIRGRDIDIDTQNITITDQKPDEETRVNCDSFVLAAGSQVLQPELK